VFRCDRDVLYNRPAPDSPPCRSLTLSRRSKFIQYKGTAIHASRINANHSVHVRITHVAPRPIGKASSISPKPRFSHSHSCISIGLCSAFESPSPPTTQFRSRDQSRYSQSVQCPSEDRQHRTQSNRASAILRECGPADTDHEHPRNADFCPPYKNSSNPGPTVEPLP
jgi:hypothetical protein